MPRRIIQVSVLALMMCLPLQGQTSRVMYFMDLPQQRFLNPAFRPSDSMYIGIPVLTGVGLTINNNFVNFSDVIIKGRSDSIITFLHPEYDKEKFLRKVRNRNSIDADAIVQLLGFGITLGKGYLFFDLTTRFSENSTFPGELIELAIRGNEPFAGQYTDLSSLGGRINMFHEVGIGYSWNLVPGLRGGIRGKFLLGVASADVDNRSLGVEINPDFSHRLNADASMNFSGHLVAVTGSGGQIDRLDFDNSRLARSVMLQDGLNPGFGLDLGLVYDINRETQVSAAITDLGFIRWRSSVSNFEVANDDFAITGVDVSNVLNGSQSFEDAFNQVIDTLQQSFAIITSESPYNSGLSPALNIGGSYRIRPDLSIGILSHSRFTGKQVHQSVTLSANYYLNNRMSASVGYTAANHRFDNIGAGIAYRIGVFQFYAASDRIPLMWNRVTADEGRSSFLLPANWNTVDFRCGMNLVFGHGKYRRADECDFWYR